MSWNAFRQYVSDLAKSSKLKRGAPQDVPDNSGRPDHHYRRIRRPRNHFATGSVDIETAGMSRILNWETEGVELICLCYVEQATPAQIRYAIRRIRRRIPEVSILIALLGNPEHIEDDETSAGTEFVQQSLRETVDKIMAFALKQTGDEISAAKPATALAS
jgi:hypothetical protein